MFVYSDRFAVLDLPAADAPAGAFRAISAAYLPPGRQIVIRENYGTFRQVMRIRFSPFLPNGKDYFQVSGDLPAAVNKGVYNFRFFCET